MLSKFFTRFAAQAGDRLHATAHSHHPWPDVARLAHIEAWDDAVALTDRKWEKIFEEVIPQVQDGLAQWLGWPDARQIVFAPNTHEFVLRLYSCLDFGKPVRVVTSSHEFHSFNRQTQRLEETGRVQVTRVNAEPYATFSERFIAAVKQAPCDMVWLSHVMFDSGFIAAPDLKAIADAAPANALVVFDGYHAVGAIPVDCSGIADRAFYLGGGYKYLMSGEGACYLAVPRGCELRPVNTGWFAEFGELSQARAGEVKYARDGMRFFGATFDASGLYRMRAVLQLLAQEGVDARKIQAHVASLQAQFLAGLGARNIAALPESALVPPRGSARGSFLTFDLENAEAIERRLEEHHIGVDRRGKRLRFGFGVYHDAAYVEKLLARLSEAFAEAA
jgi:selenocysteine lyase/cysteine desulfurase